MNHRLHEGNSEAFYYLGVKDNGDTEGIDYNSMHFTLSMLFLMASKLDVNLTLITMFDGCK